MTKPGLTEDGVDGILASTAKRAGWALCIGAGTSLPAFPDWSELVRRLFVSVDPERGEQLAAELGTRYSPDTLIQAAVARSGGDPAQFESLMTEELYRDFLAPFTGEDHRLVVRALAASRPGDLPAAKWARFLELLDEQWQGRMSCLSIGPVVSDTLGTSRSPAAILSFNAEPVLLAVLNAHQAVRSDGGSTAPQRIDPVVAGLSNHSVDRIPYFFCHGLLRVGHPTPFSKTVFSESEYLQLAARVYSWQANSFLQMCVTRRVVFVGLSLSDANMRRWLTWVHDSRLEELGQIGRGEAVSTQHFWLERDPGDSHLRAWIEASVAHMGVRLVWLQSWASIGPVLARMLDVQAR